MDKQRGKHIKKKRKGSPGSRLVMLIGSVAFLYFTGQLLGTLNSGMEVETVSASRVTVDDSITATGYFVRQESVIPATAGDTVEHVVHSGEKVHIGSRLAVEYDDPEALNANRQAKALEEQIALIQSALQSSGGLSDTAKLDQLIVIQMQALSKRTKSGMATGIEETAANLRQLMLRRGADGQDVETLRAELNALSAQKTNLQQAVSARTNIIASPATGYFSETVDGYEAILTTTDINELTVEALQSKLSLPVAEETHALGKVVEGIDWYFAVIVPNTDAADFTINQRIRLRFTQMSNDVSASVFKVVPALNGQETLLIFKSNIISSELVSMRRQVAEIIKGTYTGIKIPKEAVRVSDNKLGVYALIGSTSRFKPIEPIFEGDSFYVVRQGSTESDTGVVAQDHIIVKARGLEDMKVVKS